jgi:arsenate reductase-like glutaredoxin family protein
MDALQLLTKDHDDVKKMLEELDDTTERAIKTREQTFAKLRSELEMHLQMHEAIEEEIFYPVLRDHPKTRDIALEGYESTTWWTR